MNLYIIIIFLYLNCKIIIYNIFDYYFNNNDI